MNQTPNPLLDCTTPEYQALALDAICVALRRESESYATGIDLEAVAYSAIDALIEGRPLNEVLDMVSSEHPFAYEMRAELAKVAVRLGSSDSVAKAKVTLLDATQIPFAVEVLGVDLFGLCDRLEIVSKNEGIDLWADAYEALTVLVEGGTLQDAQARISPDHYGAPRAWAALETAAGEVEAVRALIARLASTIRRYYRLRERYPEMADTRPLSYALRDELDGELDYRTVIKHYPWRESQGWLDLMSCYDG